MNIYDYLYTSNAEGGLQVVEAKERGLGARGHELQEAAPLLQPDVDIESSSDPSQFEADLHP